MDTTASATSPSSSVSCSGAVHRESLGLCAVLDLLEDVDFESTMLVLAQSENDGGTPAASRRRLSSVLRRGSMDTLDLSLTSLAELFPSQCEGDSLHFLPDDVVTGLASPSRRASAANANAATGDLKIHAPLPRASMIKAEFPHSPAVLSPTMDSFLRESWGDMNDLATKTRRTSSKLLEGLLGHSLLSPTSASPRRMSLKLQTNGSSVQTHLFTTAPSVPPSSMRGPVSSSLKPPPTAATEPLKNPKIRASPKQPRRAKECVEEGCTRRAQSNNRCKTHGGGARCQMTGCDKSSQGGGLCRAHGGGKKCRVSGCTKGTQRLGLCYLHGGIRRCVEDGCKKKDRGNGYCISHGGGRRCEVAGCMRSVRKGNHCQTHQGLEEAGNESPFKISRGHGLHPVIS